MKKSILNLKGAQELTKKEQKSISGGLPPLLPCGAECTGIGNKGCQSGFCLLDISGHAYCTC